MSNEELIDASLQRLDALLADEVPHYVLRFTWTIIKDVGLMLSMIFA